MKYRRKWAAVILVGIITVSMSSCGGSEVAENTESITEDIEVTQNTTTAANDTTTADTTESTETDIPDTEKPDSDSVTVYYGWDIDDMDCTAEIFCPEGAKFDDYTLEVQASDGWVLSAEVIDEANEYSAVSNSYWHPDAYSSDDPILSILQQLYFEGGIDAQTAEEYSNCSQKVTPLGFKWNDYDVIMIETSYTFLDYGEQTDTFVGVEYDLNYWTVEEGTGETVDRTTKGLFGFDVFSYNREKLTQDQCAWIVGKCFGVDSGIENPFPKNGKETEDVSADVDASALLGTWVDKTSSWEDTYFFDYNSNGSYTSGFENTFTWSVEGNTLTVFYAEDDVDLFGVRIDDDYLVLADKYGYEQRFEKVAEGAETDIVTDSSAEEAVNPNTTAIIGTWTESTTGLSETFAFNADGTGHYSRLNNEGGIYECTFTYEFFRSDYIDIYYDDGEIGGFLIAIDGDTLTVRNDFVQDLSYTRQ